MNFTESRRDSSQSNEKECLLHRYYLPRCFHRLLGRHGTYRYLSKYTVLTVSVIATQSKRSKGLPAKCVLGKTELQNKETSRSNIWSQRFTNRFRTFLHFQFENKIILEHATILNSLMKLNLLFTSRGDRKLFCVIF